MHKTVAYSKFNSGVTLVELMIVVAIAALLASIGIPSYREMVVSNKISSVVSDLHSSFLLARSEALKRGTSVTVCKSSAVNGSDPVCDPSASAVGWGTGWIIFVDADGSRTRQLSEPIIQVKGPYFISDTEGKIVSNAVGAAVQFNRTGQTFANTQFTVNAPSSMSTQDRTVCVVIGGRAKVVSGSTC